MQEAGSKRISVHATHADFMAISESASQYDMPISRFMRLASLEKANIRPFFSEEDLSVLWHLRNELKEEGIQLMDSIRALNRGEVKAVDGVKANVVALYRIIAALSIELRACVRVGAGLQLGTTDDTL